MVPGMPCTSALNRSLQDCPLQGQLSNPPAQGHQTSIPICCRGLWAWAEAVTVLYPDQGDPEVSVCHEYRVCSRVLHGQHLLTHFPDGELTTPPGQTTCPLLSETEPGGLCPRRQVSQRSAQEQPAGLRGQGEESQDLPFSWLNIFLTHYPPPGKNFRPLAALVLVEGLSRCLPKVRSRTVHLRGVTGPS